MILLNLINTLLRFEKGILWKSTKSPVLLQSGSLSRSIKPLIQPQQVSISTNSFGIWKRIPWRPCTTKAYVNVTRRLLDPKASSMMQQQYYDYTSDEFPGLAQQSTGYEQQLPSAVLKLRGLPWTSTITDIIEFFGSSVNIANGNDGIHLISNPEGRPTGEAYIEVATEEDITEGLKKNKNSMGHRYIEVFKAKRAEMEWILRKNDPTYVGSTGIDAGYGTLPLGGGYSYPAGMDPVEAAVVNYASAEVTNPFANLTAEECETFVRLRGLPFECSTNDIFNFFKGLEVDPNGVHMVDDGTGRNTGEAYIQFTSKEDADKALENDRQCIGHRYIEVFRVGPAELRNYNSSVSKRTRSRETRPGPYDRPRGRGRPGQPLARYPEDHYGGPGRQDRYFSQRYDNWYSSHAGSGSPLEPPPPPPPPLIPGLKRMGANGYGADNSKNWVLMRGLPFKSTEKDILEFFQPLAPAFVHIIYDASGRPSGTAKVVFASPEDVNAAMGKHKNLMEHRYIELFPGGLNN